MKMVENFKTFYKNHEKIFISKIRWGPEPPGGDPWEPRVGAHGIPWRGTHGNPWGRPMGTQALGAHGPRIFNMRVHTSITHLILSSTMNSVINTPLAAAASCNI